MKTLEQHIKEMTDRRIGWKMEGALNDAFGRIFWLTERVDALEAALKAKESDAKPAKTKKEEAAA